MLSRVADSLYWMARYLERAEHTARMLDVNLNLMLDEDPENGDQRWRRLLESLDITKQDGPPADADATQITHFLTLDLDSSSSILSSIAYARNNARQLREHISSEMWEQLNRLFLELRRETSESLWSGQPHEFCRQVREGVSLFNGITVSTINHGEAWQFIQLGRFLERAANISSALDVHFRSFYDFEDSSSQAADFMEWVGLLKSCAAFEAYCRVYTADFNPTRIAEFLLLNAEFPQAVCFSVTSIHDELLKIAGGGSNGKNERLQRLTGKWCSTLQYTQIDEILNEKLHGFLDDIKTQCSIIHQAVYQTYITYPIESAIAPS